MFKLAAAVLALAAVGIQGRPHSDSGDHDCTGKADGFYADVTNPKVFFSCLDEVVEKTVFCVDGYKFDGIDQCVPDVQEEEEEEKEQDVKVEVQERERPTIPQVFSDNGDDGFIDDDEFKGGQGRRIFNIEITKNIFPRSVVIIGKMNREQKNK